MESIEKLKRIAEGWKNLTFKTPTVEELAKIRAEICSECEYSVDSIFEMFSKEHRKIIKKKGIICADCKCPIAAKVRSTKEKCPQNKW
jgi:hypothetical protein